MCIDTVVDWIDFVTAECCCDAMTDCIDIATGWISTAAGSIDTAADWDTMAGWVDTAADLGYHGWLGWYCHWLGYHGWLGWYCHWLGYHGWLCWYCCWLGWYYDRWHSRGYQQQAGDVTEERRLMKCCSTTAGDKNCLARWVVTFVMHDLP